MMKNRKHILLFAVACMLVLSSCNKVVVRVTEVPPNTPSGQAIYITGNFNKWDPGDNKYRLQLQADSSYTIELPPGIGSMKYKFTRGDWTSVEKDLCGYDIKNHDLVLGEYDTINHFIESWGDLDPVNCTRLTLVLNHLPKNTPEEDRISVAGNFNSWDPESHIFNRNEYGDLYISISKPPGISTLEYKIFRGDLSKAEADEFGNILTNRITSFGLQDSVLINVEGWIDQREKSGSPEVVIYISKLPPSSRATDDLYLASSVNNWTADDRNYLFQKDKQGRYFFTLPRKRKVLDYKITRGSWNSVEVDAYGFDTPNRVLDLVNEDTAYIEVMGWKDRDPVSDQEVTIVINQLPENTPPGSDLFLAGNINDWAQNNRRYQFEQQDNGTYSLNIKRGYGLLQFKVLRGSWDKMEVDEFGTSTPDRSMYYKDVDTILVSVSHWSDLPPESTRNITIVIQNMPPITPELDELYLASNINDWNPGAEEYIFNYLPDGKPFLSLENIPSSLEYKITRGNWDTVEADTQGDPIPDRVQYVGFSDTVYIDIKTWRDLGGRY